MGRLKRLVLYCSTGNVCFAEPNDRIRLFWGADEIVGAHQMRPPTRNHTSACVYSVDLDYPEFLNRQVRLELDGDGLWGSQDPFLMGELEEDGHRRWIPLGHDLGETQKPEWTTRSDPCTLTQLTEAERHSPLRDLVVTMSVELAKHDLPRTIPTTPSGTVEMSVFIGENSAPAILYQTLRQVSFDGCHSASSVWFFHLPVRGGIPFTADGLSGAQFSVDLDSAWTDHVFRVFGIDAVARKGRLLGCSAEAAPELGRYSARWPTAHLCGDLIPVTVTSVRRRAPQPRPLNPWLTVRWRRNQATQEEVYPPSGACWRGRLTKQHRTLPLTHIGLGTQRVPPTASPLDKKTSTFV